jgi:hypothetical protein
MASPPPIVFLDIDGVLNDAAFLDKRDAELSTLATILSDAAIQHDPHKGTLSLAERAQRAVDGWQAMSDAEDAAQAELGATRVQLRRLVEALPRCVHVQDLHTNPRSCPRAATKGPQDQDDRFLGDLWCDEHAPTDRDIRDCDWLEDLPWGDVIRELAGGEGGM